MANPNASLWFNTSPSYEWEQSSCKQIYYHIWISRNIFTGDLVILSKMVLLHLTLATETNNIGVFAGWHTLASDGSYVYSQYWPSGTVATDIVAYVYDDPYDRV